MPGDVKPEAAEIEKDDRPLNAAEIMRRYDLYRYLQVKEDDQKDESTT